LGTAFFLEPVFLVQRFSSFEQPPARTQAGLLGMDLLASSSITIDWRAGTLELARRHERAADPDAAVVALATAGNLPTIDARIGPVSIPCRLDTGATWAEPRPLLDVNRAAVRALERAGVVLRPGAGLGALGVGGGETLAVLETDLALELGPVKIERVSLVVH